MPYPFTPVRRLPHSPNLGASSLPNRPPLHTRCRRRLPNPPALPKSPASPASSTTSSSRSRPMDGQDGGRHNGADGYGGSYGHTRDFLSPQAAFPPGFPYNPVYPPPTYGMASSSSLQPSRLDFDALDLNSASEWSDTPGFGDLVRPGGAAVRQGPPPVRVPARSERGTLGLRGPRGGRGLGGPAFLGGGSAHVGGGSAFGDASCAAMAGGSAFMGGHPAAMPGGYVPYGGASAFHGGYVSPTPNPGGSARGPARGGRRRNARRRSGVYVSSPTCFCSCKLTTAHHSAPTLCFCSCKLISVHHSVHFVPLLPVV